MTTQTAWKHALTGRMLVAALVTAEDNLKRVVRLLGMTLRGRFRQRLGGAPGGAVAAGAEQAV
jgi:hypothetical protein